LYNTRAVYQMTDVPADTFRAWERRYGLPRPHRTPGNQRLYSERDIGVISWLRDRTDEGMTISQAVSRLRIEYPDLLHTEPAPEPVTIPQVSVVDPQLKQMRERFVAAVADYDDQAGEHVIDEALALFTIEEACTRLIEPALIEIGERWSRNELSVAVEHFATRLVTRRLSSVFNLVSPPTGRGTVVAACVPGEEHEVGLLILSIFLARRNWRVVYLGANVPLDDLLETIRQVQPQLVCLSAATPMSADRALNVARSVASDELVHLPVAVGGRGFCMSEQSSAPPGVHYLAGGAAEVADQIAEIVLNYEITRRVGRVLD
jgi:methanogenic corrinoid protein MtbC1